MLVVIRGKTEENLLPASWSARTRINEYGGKSYALAGEKIFFCNQKDQCIYWIDSGRKVHQLTNEQNVLYGDLLFDPIGNRLICTEEQMEGKGSQSLISIDLETKAKKVLAEGDDFYSSVALSPNGTKLAYLSWNYPSMPWDAACLTIVSVEKDGSLAQEKLVVDKEYASVFQPMWAPDGKLFFISEKSGYWNLYSLEGKKIEAVLSMDAEFGVPQWYKGISTYAVVPNDDGGYQILCAYIQKGIGHLALIDVAAKNWREIKTPFTYFTSVTADKHFAYFIAGSSSQFLSIVQMDVHNEVFTIVKSSKNLHLEVSELSTPQEITFLTTDNERAYGFYYPPKNSSYRLPQKEKPPLIVLAHGGPTAQAFPILSLGVQFWTSRGYAVVDVNYRGSSGYGRAFRKKLYGHILYSVDDCIAAAQDLIEKGLVDTNRLIIKGGSAGGYTALAALAFRNVFHAAVSYYGMSDLECIVKETHRFEARYGDLLVGPYPEKKQLYEELSPIHYADKIAFPTLFFHGLEDKIVPPDQSKKMFAALKRNGVTTALLLFEKEGHGFQRASNLKHCLEAEEYFYSQIFGLSLPKKIPTIPMENLSKRPEK